MTTEQLLKNLERPCSKIDVILDTDAYNEIDDQFAIAYMLANRDKLNVKAIYAAPFHNDKSSGPKDGMEKSYDEIKKVLSMIESTGDIEVLKGSDSYLQDENTPVKSDAAAHLIKLAGNYSTGNPLYVVAIGAITNIASALIFAPEIRENIVVVWLGGSGHHWMDIKEFNMFQDVAAARVIFGCGVPLVQLPCQGVVSAFTISEPELEKWLLGKNKICDYLARNTIEEANSYASGRPWTRVIWDVTAVAWLIDGRFFHERLEKSPIPEYDGYYAFNNDTRHFIKYIYHINRDELMDDMIAKLLKLT